MKIKEQGYNELPYDSLAYYYNRPETLKSFASLFGMETPALESSRILELGCADGFNLYRFSETYPKSYTLGVDLSRSQVDNGKKVIKELGLKNIELEAMSITDLDKSYGKFDYIICHGVFSWVPKVVRDGVLEVSKSLLSKKGVVFISYNTLPGWYEKQIFRDLMKYHCQQFADTKDRVAQSRAILSFVQDLIKGRETPYSQYVDHISDQTDSYLRHEYLAEENKAFYFHEFVDMAKKSGLKYLCDTDIQKMYVGNSLKGLSDAFPQITDIVKLEQYIDFIMNNKFRCSVLCHEGVATSCNIQNEALKKFYYYGYLVPKTPANEINLTDDSNFVAKDNISKRTMASSDPIMKAILMSLCKNVGNPLTISEIIDYTKKLVPEAGQEEIKTNINTNFPRLVLSSLLKFVADRPNTVFKVTKKPKISRFNLFQLRRAGYQRKIIITNALNCGVNCDRTQSIILKMLDGTRTIEQLKREALHNLKKEAIFVNQIGKEIEDNAYIKEVCDLLVDQTLDYIRKNFCLIY